MLFLVGNEEIHDLSCVLAGATGGTSYNGNSWSRNASSAEIYDDQSIGRAAELGGSAWLEDRHSCL